MSEARRSAHSVAAWPAMPVADREAEIALAFADAVPISRSHGVYIAMAPQPSTPAEGELAGLPLAVKDNIDVAGLPTTAGSSLLRGAYASVDAGVVGILREAGAVVVGKTNMHELAFGVTSNNAAFGPVRNPFDHGRVAGGSSGGSAASVALGSVPASLGTDTGGSVTIPASFCGVVGFRPTTGRYPGDGLVNLSWTRDTIGLHTRTVTDARLIDRVITRATPGPVRALRDVVIGVPRSRYADVDPEVDAVAARMLGALCDAGVRLVDVSIEADREIVVGHGLSLVSYEAERSITARAIAARGPQRIRSFADTLALIESPDVRSLAEMIATGPVPPAVYADAIAARGRLRRHYATMFDTTGVHAVLAPACPVLPPRVGEDDVIQLNGREVPLFATVLRNTGPGSLAGVPMLTLPAGAGDSGLPVGMYLEAPFWDDENLLVLGEQIQSALGGLPS